MVKKSLANKCLMDNIISVLRTLIDDEVIHDQQN